MTHLWQDLRVALRSLRSAPLMMTVTVVSLALGIGAVTTVFTIANALLLNTPSGWTDPESLVGLYTSRDDGKLYGRVSFPDYRDLQAAESPLQDAAAYSRGAVNLGTGTASKVLLVEAVTGNYFDVLGIRAALGRTFIAEEASRGSDQRAVVISHDLWQSHFAGDPDMVGREIRLAGQPYDVIGVTPEGIGQSPFMKLDAWVPVEASVDSGVLGIGDLDERGDRRFSVMGRLREGRTLEEVQAHLGVVGRNLHQTYSVAWQDDRGEPRVFSALSEKDARMDPDRRAVLAVLGVFLFGATGLILLIACSNVASLFLARAHRRRRATAVRLALGANQWRLVTSNLAESLLPALISAVLGFGLAAVAIRAIGSIPSPVAIPLHFDFQMDYRVLGFAILLALITSVLFGLAPALAGSKTDLVPALKSDSTSSGRRPGRFGLRNLLVVGQVAASMVLLASAGLFLRSLSEATVMNFGIDPSRVSVMTKTLPEASAEPGADASYLQELTSRLAALPEVEAAHASRAIELTVVSAPAVPVGVPGHESASGEVPRVHYNSVTPGYLDMLSVPLLRGRTLRSSDGPDATPVAVINANMAERFWPGASAIGERFTAGERSEVGDESVATTFEVVGVTADTKVADIDDPPMPYFWTSLYQDPSPKVALLVKGRTSTEDMIQLMYREVEVAENEVTLVPPTALSQMIDLQFLPLRAASVVLGSGGVFGLLLAVLGIYGIISFAVAQRTREVAIRMALGARRSQVLKSIMRDGLVLTAVGLAVGMVIVVPLARLVRSLLFGMSPLDPLAIGGGAGILMLAALLACFVPARQATNINPIGPLREE